MRRPSPWPEISVSERRHRAQLALAALLASTALSAGVARAQDLPTGASVVSGGAEIARPSASEMRVTQSGDRAIVNWRDFSIGEGARVDFAQPGPGSAVLNRVTGPLGSRIDGRLTANGQVFLVNPGGVVVGETGRVETGGLVANEDFRQGRLRFEGDGASAAVANHGTIAVRNGGMAALLGGKITNTGTISAPLGRIGVGAGERATLDLTGDRFLQIALPSDTSEEVLIDQAGRVSAE
ncbi:MAG: filamentous hemagglutinin N-terminal domain-containing protein, partial [Deinococcus-Thermus bacterium]|nr:filamentous hemagglutinin N-terminal domain-containing protein [Deinococcota bacterium]